MTAHRYRLTDFDTGDYQIGEGGKREPGVTLWFVSLDTGEIHHVCFNVLLTYARNTRHAKAGDRLPRKQFRVEEAKTNQWAIVRFWERTLLPKPKLSEFWKAISKLKKVILIGEYDESKQRIKKDSLRAENYVPAVKSSAKSEISLRQSSDNSETSFCDKDLTAAQANKGVEADKCACDEIHVLSKQVTSKQELSPSPVVHQSPADIDPTSIPELWVTVEGKRIRLEHLEAKHYWDEKECAAYWSKVLGLTEPHEAKDQRMACSD